MDVREKLFTLFQDCNNPSWKWFPNNAEMLKLIEYLVANGVTVQVVRCRDCKYWGDEAGVAVRTDGVRFARCKVHNLCVRGKKVGWCPMEDDFCSQGERRTDNENR